jgi:hypothetical protein
MFNDVCVMQLANSCWLVAVLNSINYEPLSARIITNLLIFIAG